MNWHHRIGGRTLFGPDGFIVARICKRVIDGEWSADWYLSMGGTTTQHATLEEAVAIAEATFLLIHGD